MRDGYQHSEALYRMSARGRVLELFYDVVSPYSWIGFEVFCRYKPCWNIDFRFRPAFLGGIMKESGNKPPALVPNKFSYMVADLQRLAKFCQVPLSLPHDPFESMFEKGSLSAMRFITAVQVSHPELVESVSREIWMRIWSRDEDITQQDSLFAAGIAAGIPERTVQKLLEVASTPEVKSHLKAATDEVLQFGVSAFLTEPVLVLLVEMDVALVV
ncbi:glutathione S-transferase kappa 1-like [Scyliorhinus canicula]|uniref:glutathione S-transferase kappa 1-like n=1 Tax=Scyliorhinus canicula TaxID=7830 RepID=UPI0018F4B55D|nr:glutathione S-transferase kappa 1-like [Scyliorhinus canicula]